MDRRYFTESKKGLIIKLFALKVMFIIPEQILSNDMLTKELTDRFSGPIILSYVWWILSTALQKKISKLYFLARDGYLLHEVAKDICNCFSLPIQCSYLFCSRASLRMPSYHLLSKEEIYQLLLQGGYRITLKSILERANLNENERQKVYIDCGMPNPDEEHLLNANELETLRSILKSSEVLYRLIMHKSHLAYQNAVGYLEQEGLPASEQIALVDSGWTGSMQRSLRQLLDSLGYCGSIVGFYFGMYAKPKSQEDGEYLTWYFDHRRRTSDKITFCNNLFECLLPAPHGMTIEYEFRNGVYAPVFLKRSNAMELKRIQTHIHQVLAYVREYMKSMDFYSFQEQAHKRETRKRVIRYMTHPTKDEADFYGKIRFCDDITEGYHLSLAEKGQVSVLKNYLFFPRLIRRLRKHNGEQQAELFWPYGTIAFLPKWKQSWYRWNVYLWEWIRYVRQ